MLELESGIQLDISNVCEYPYDTKHYDTKKPLVNTLNWKDDEQVRQLYEKILEQRIKDDFSDSGCASTFDIDKPNKELATVTKTKETETEPIKNNTETKSNTSPLSNDNINETNNTYIPEIDIPLNDYAESFKKYGAYFPPTDSYTQKQNKEIMKQSGDESRSNLENKDKIDILATNATEQRESRFYKSSASDIRNRNNPPQLNKKLIDDFNNLPWQASIEEPFELGPPFKGCNYLNQFPGSLFNTFGRVFLDDSEIELYIHCLKKSPIVTYSLLLFVLTLFVILGHMANIPSFITSLLVGLVLLFMYLIPITYKELWSDIKNKLDRKRHFFWASDGFKAWLLYPTLQSDRAAVRKHFIDLGLNVPPTEKPPSLNNTPHQEPFDLFELPDVEQMIEKDISPFQANIQTNVVDLCLTQGISLNITPNSLKDFETESQIEEIKSNSYPKNQTEINNSTRTLLIDDRPFLDITLPNGTVIRGMLDTGSTSCCIHPRVYNNLIKTHAVPLINTRCKITGVVPGASTENEKVALVTLKIGDKTYSKVPSIVHDSGSDYLIGCNLIKSGKFSQFWIGPDYYVQLGLEKDPSKYVRAHFQKNSVLSACLLDNLELDPDQYNVFPLAVPELEGLRFHNFKHKNLSIRQTDRVTLDSGFVLVDAITKVTPEGFVCALITNKSVAPISIPKGTAVGLVEIATDQGDDPNIYNPLLVREYQNIVKNIEIDSTIACYCDVLRAKHCLIMFTDIYGHTYTQYNYIARQGSLEPLNTGFILDDSENKSRIMFIVPNANNSFENITEDQINDISVQALEKGIEHFYFYDNIRTDLSISQLKVLALLHQKVSFKRIVFDKQYLDEGIPFHNSCFPVGFAFPHNILTGCSVTRIHFQIGARAPDTDDLNYRSSNSKEHEIVIENSRTLYYRLDSTLVCHVHAPVAGLTNLKLQKLVYSLFKGLRSIMCSTHFVISMSLPMGQNAVNKWLLIRETIGKIPAFRQCSSKCLVMLRSQGTKKVNLICRTCNCSLCMFDRNRGHHRQAETVTVFDGDINALTNKQKINKPIRTPKVDNQEVAHIRIAKMVVSSCMGQEEEVFDLPQDPMNMFNESELQEYLKELPGTVKEPEDFDDTKHEWRDFVDISGVPEHLKERFERLMDSHYELFAFNKNHKTKFIQDGDKPAICDMELKTDRPIFTKSYPLSSKMASVLDEKIDELLARDEIERVVSDYNSPILLVAHNSDNKHKDFKDKKFRLCLDLRIINSQILMKNRFSYLVAGVQLLYERLHGHNYFTKIDMSKAYRSLLCSPRMQQMCAFRAPYSIKYSLDVFAFRSIPDGWALAPEQYSLFIKKALTQESRNCTICHIDDVLVCSPNADQHMEDVTNVFRDLMRANFMLSLPKFQTFQKTVLFLGHIVDGKTITIPEDRKSYFNDLKEPTTKKEVQSLLGLANYMANHLDNYQLKVGPLYDSIKNKDDKAVFELDELQKKSFQELKLAVINAPQIHLMDFSKTLFVECDASISGTGSLLYQESGPYDKRSIIRFGSKRYTLPETLNMTSLDREGNAILVATFIHSFYINNSPDVVFKTDLKPLISILSCYNDPENTKMRNISHRLYSLSVRWSLVHTAGVSIPITDALSRIYTPYRCAFSEKVDNSLSNIQLPEDWTLCPNLVLTTADIVEAIRRQIVFIEKSSPAVKVKRLKALQSEVKRTSHLLGDRASEISTVIEGNLYDFSEMVIESKKIRKDSPKTDHDFLNSATIGALKLAPINPGVTVFEKLRFLIKSQDEDPSLAKIKQTLLMKKDISNQIRKKYRIMNENILVTRKDMNLPFEFSNLQIVCNTYMAIVLLAIIHIFQGHYGINTLADSFKSFYRAKNIYGLSKIICLSCKACRLQRHSQAKPLPALRVPIPCIPNDTWYMDHMVFKQDTFLKNIKVAACLTIFDGYSNMFQAYMVKNLTSKEVIESLKKSFSILSPPRKIVSDNASPLVSDAVRTFLETSGVIVITTITPYNSRANLVERAHKTFRELLLLNSETFQRKPLELFHHCVQQMNTRPLTKVHHPNIQCKLEAGEIVSPFSLHYGFPPQKGILDLNDLDDSKRQQYQTRWQKIIREHDELLQEELNERIKKFKTPTEFTVGSLVLLKDMTHHKEEMVFNRNVYEIVDIQKAKFYIKPLFGLDKPFFVNGNNLKRYTTDALLLQLPPDIRNLLGEQLDPEMLKKCSDENRNVMPKDFENWNLLKNPTPIQLRYRLYPPSIDSVPAVDISDRDLGSISTSTDSSDSFLFGPNGPLHQPNLPFFNPRPINPSDSGSSSSKQTEPYRTQVSVSPYMSQYSHGSLHSVHDSIRSQNTPPPFIVAGAHNISDSIPDSISKSDNNSKSSESKSSSSSSSDSDPRPPGTKYILRSKDFPQACRIDPIPPKKKRTQEDSNSSKSSDSRKRPNPNQPAIDTPKRRPQRQPKPNQRIFNQDFVHQKPKAKKVRQFVPSLPSIPQSPSNSQTNVSNTPHKSPTAQPNLFSSPTLSTHPILSPPQRSPRDLPLPQTPSPCRKIPKYPSYSDSDSDIDDNMPILPQNQYLPDTTFEITPQKKQLKDIKVSPKPETQIQKKSPVYFDLADSVRNDSHIDSSEEEDAYFRTKTETSLAQDQPQSPQIKEETKINSPIKPSFQDYRTPPVNFDLGSSSDNSPNKTTEFINDTIFKPPIHSTPLTKNTPKQIHSETPIRHISFTRQSSSSSDTEENENQINKPESNPQAKRQLLTKELVKRRLDFSKTIHPNKMLKESNKDITVENIAQPLASDDDSMQLLNQSQHDTTQNMPSQNASRNITQEMHDKTNLNKTPNIIDTSMKDKTKSIIDESMKDQSKISPAKDVPMYSPLAPDLTYSIPSASSSSSDSVPSPRYSLRNRIVPTIPPPLPPRNTIIAPQIQNIPIVHQPVLTPQNSPPHQTHITPRFTPPIGSPIAQGSPRVIPLSPRFTPPTVNPVAQGTPSSSPQQNQTHISTPRQTPPTVSPVAQGSPVKQTSPIKISSPLKTPPKQQIIQPQLETQIQPEPEYQGRPKRQTKRPNRYFGQEYQTELPNPLPKWIDTPEKLKQPKLDSKSDLEPKAKPKSLKSINKVIDWPQGSNAPFMGGAQRFRPSQNIDPISDLPEKREKEHKTNIPSYDPGFFESLNKRHNIPVFSKTPKQQNIETDIVQSPESVKSVSFRSPVETESYYSPPKADESGKRKAGSLNESFKDLMRRTLPKIIVKSTPKEIPQALNNMPPPKSILSQTPKKEAVKVPETQTKTQTEQTNLSSNVYEELKTPPRAKRQYQSDSDDLSSPYDPQKDVGLQKLMQNVKHRHHKNSPEQQQTNPNDSMTTFISERDKLTEQIKAKAAQNPLDFENDPAIKQMVDRFVTKHKQDLRELEISQQLENQNDSQSFRTQQTPSRQQTINQTDQIMHNTLIPPPSNLNRISDQFPSPLFTSTPIVKPISKIPSSTTIMAPPFSPLTPQQNAAINMPQNRVINQPNLDITPPFLDISYPYATNSPRTPPFNITPQKMDLTQPISQPNSPSHNLMDHENSIHIDLGHDDDPMLAQNVSNNDTNQPNLNRSIDQMPPPPIPTASNPRTRSNRSRSSSRGSVHKFNRYHKPDVIRHHPYTTRSGRISRPPKRYGQDE